MQKNTNTPADTTNTDAIRARLLEVAAETDTMVAAKQAGKVARAAKKAPVINECLCGCGGETQSRFVPGHDGRLKGRLLRAAHGEGGESEDERIEALERLTQLGWDHFFVPRIPKGKAIKAKEASAAA